MWYHSVLNRRTKQQQLTSLSIRWNGDDKRQNDSRCSKRGFGCFEAIEAFSDSLFPEEGKIGYVRSHMQRAGIYHRIQFDTSRYWCETVLEDVPACIIKIIVNTIICATHYCVCVINTLPFSDGMSRSGVFIACMTEIERVKAEGAVDIFQTVKAARGQRPHMVYIAWVMYGMR